MARILSGGGQSAAGKPTTRIVGRPGFGSVARGFRQGVRRLSKRDPADAVISANIRDIPAIDRGFASLTTALAGTNNDLKYTAQFAGFGGNSVRVAYLVAGNNTPLSVAVSGNDVNVSVATDGVGAATSTAAQVMAAVNAHAQASKMVRAELAAGNDGTGVVAALAATALTGGDEGEMRDPLPPELTSAPSGATEVNLDSEENPPISRAPGVTRVRDRSANRALRRR